MTTRGVILVGEDECAFPGCQDLVVSTWNPMTERVTFKHLGASKTIDDPVIYIDPEREHKTKGEARLWAVRLHNLSE